MKTINILLENKEIKITNTETIYLEPKEDVKFIIINSLAPSDRLFFCVNGKTEETKNKEFIVSYGAIKKDLQLSVTLKSDSTIYPTLFVLKDFKVNDVKVVGDTIDERYPEVIQELYREIVCLRKAILQLHEDIETHKKEGVI